MKELMLGLRIIVCLLVLIVVLPSQATNPKRVQRVVNKGITDINDIRVRPRARKIFIKNNNINNIEDYTIPDHIRNFTFRENNTDYVNGLVLGSNLRKLMLFNTGLKDINNIEWNKIIDYIEFSFNNLSTLDGIDLSETNLRRFDAIDNKIESLNGLILNETLETILLSGNRLKTVEDFNFPSSLKILYLSNNLLKSFNGANLNPNLESLVISLNVFEHYSDIKNLPIDLKSLQFASAFAGSQDCTGLVLPESLERLVFAVTLKATQEDIKTLALPPHLRELILSRNRISSLDGLEFPVSLRVLDLRHNPISPQERRKIRQRFRKENPRLKIVF
jgi:hypothetical protein